MKQSANIRYVDGQVFVTPTFGTKKRIGHIDNGKLTVTETDNYHWTSKSLGVDKAIIFSKLLNFTQVHFKFHGYPYATTRRYFADKGKKRSLMNGREQIFLELKELKLSVGLAHDKRLADREKKKNQVPADLAKMDIFDVFITQIRRGITNNRLFRRWEKLINGNQVDNGGRSS